MIFNAEITEITEFEPSNLRVLCALCV